MKIKIKPFYVFIILFLITTIIGLMIFDYMVVSLLISIILSVYLSNKDDNNTIWKNKKGIIKKAS